MHQNDIDHFLANVTCQFDFLRRNLYQGAEDYGDTAVLEFQLPQAIPIDEFLDLIEDEHIDMIILYHVQPSAATIMGQRACAYSNPSFGNMYKFNAVSDDDGKVSTLYVTLYECMITMGMELRDELKEQTGNCRVLYAREEAELLRDFMR